MPPGESGAALKEEIGALKGMGGGARKNQWEFHPVLFDHGADAFFVHQPTGGPIVLNRWTCDILGFTRDKLLGLVRRMDEDQDQLSG